MSNYTEEFIYVFVYSMYGKCQIQIVHYVRFAVIEPIVLQKMRTILCQRKKKVFPPSTPVLHIKV